MNYNDALTVRPDGDGWILHDGTPRDTGSQLFDVAYGTGIVVYGAVMLPWKWEDISGAPLDDLVWYREHRHAFVCQHCGEAHK